MTVRSQEIRGLSDEDLTRELESSQRELLNLRMRLATRQLANTSQIRVARKNIARLLTIMRERQMEAP
jgi:large subunit ribosomal protein L29